jgi:hypothetical protein
MSQILTRQKAQGLVSTSISKWLLKRPTVVSVAIGAGMKSSYIKISVRLAGASHLNKYSASMRPVPFLWLIGIGINEGSLISILYPRLEVSRELIERGSKRMV